VAGEKADIQIAHCPERVLPGHVLQELVNNDRIIGGISKKCALRAISLYKTFVKGECLVTTARTAELSKLTENAFRDVNIAFANELSMVCDAMDINVWELINLANRHPRVDVLQPGAGVGGHCIAVDPWFIVDSLPEQTPLIRTARLVNDGKPAYVIDRVLAKAERFRNPSIACFGLAYKADIDDLRESPAMKIAQELIAASVGKVLLVEPNVQSLPSIFSGSKNVKLVGLREALEHSDIIVGLVDHTEFKDISPEKLKDKIVIDPRGIWS